MANRFGKLWRRTAIAILALVLLLALALWSARFWLETWLEDTVAERTGRELAIGELDIDWSLNPLLTARDVRFANADWSEQEQMASARQVELRVSLLSLLHGQLSFPLLRLQDPSLLLQQGPDEQVNWDFGRKKDQKKGSAPDIGRLQIDGGSLRYLERDQQTDMQLSVQSDPDAEPGKILQAQGQGRFRGQSMRVDFQGGSLQDLLTPEAPYPVHMNLAAADTDATLEGEILDPRALDSSDLNLELTVQGPDPARLYELFEIPLPSLPPYKVTGKLVRDGKNWKLSNFDGHVGDSDLHGDLALSFDGERPMIEADLRSKSLDFDDLGTLVGGKPGTGSDETVAPEQQQRAREGKPVLPDRQADLAQFREVDADVRFRGENVRAGGLPVDEVELHFLLDHGELKLDPLRFRAGGGKVDATITGNAKGEALDLKLDGDVSRLNLQRLLADLEIANDSVGTVGGRAKLWLHGNSMAALLGSADGGIYLIMTGGRLDHFLVEIAGLDLGEALLTKLGGQESIPINCAYADMQARSGVVHLNDVIIDSTDTLFTASGTINLRTEALDIELTPKPKDVSLIAARSQLQIGGTLGDPDVKPGPATLVKGAAAAALAAVAGPAAALVPLVETGGGKDNVACRSFTDAVEAGQVGAAPEPEQSP